MKKRSHVRTSKRLRNRLSPYRRLEAELATARRATVNAANHYVEVLKGLGDALKFIDRLQHTKDDGWSSDDVKRLAELRKLAVR